MHKWSVTVQGWGEDDDGNTEIDLARVNLAVIKKSLCNAKYENVKDSWKNLYMPNLIIDAMFCTDGWEYAGTCHGFSGGPTIIQ